MLRRSRAPVGRWVGAHQDGILCGSGCGGECHRCPGSERPPAIHTDTVTGPPVPCHPGS